MAPRFCFQVECLEDTSRDRKMRLVLQTKSNRHYAEGVRCSCNVPENIKILPNVESKGLRQKQEQEVVGITHEDIAAQDASLGEKQQ